MPRLSHLLFIVAYVLLMPSCSGGRGGSSPGGGGSDTPTVLSLSKSLIPRSVAALGEGNLLVEAVVEDAAKTQQLGSYTLSPSGDAYTSPVQLDPSTYQLTLSIYYKGNVQQARAAMATEGNILVCQLKMQVTLAQENINNTFTLSINALDFLVYEDALQQITGSSGGGNGGGAGGTEPSGGGDGGSSGGGSGGEASGGSGGDGSGGEGSGGGSGGDGSGGGSGGEGGGTGGGGSGEPTPEAAPNLSAENTIITNLGEEGYGITLGGDGKLYAIGYMEEAGQGGNIWLGQFETNLAEAWLRKIHSDGAHWDTGNALATATEAGNTVVYAAGYVRPGNDQQAWLAKYTAAGHPMWVINPGNQGTPLDEARSITVDSAGDVYVAGSHFVDGEGTNAWVAKYNKDGQAQWNEPFIYEGSGNGDDGIAGIAANNQGHLYIAGFETVAGQGANAWIGKLNTATGALENSVSFDAGDGVNESALSIVIHPSGHPIVAGYVTSTVQGPAGNHKNVWVRRYDPDFNSVWTETMDGPTREDDLAKGIALDTEGQVYVTGQFVTTSFHDTNIWLAKLNASNGDVIWTQFKNTPGALVEWGNSIAVDAQKRIFIIGRTFSGTTMSNIWMGVYSP